MYLVFNLSIEPSEQSCYIISERGTTAHKGLTDYKNSKTTPNRPKYKGGFAMYGYLQNENINVSNARRKRPKVIKSLKSK